MTAESALKKYASMESSYLRTPVLDEGNPAEKRQEIADYFNFT